MKTHSAWSIRQDGFVAEDVAKNGSKFIIGNGRLGVRGTLEEFGAPELVACTLAGLYDQVGDLWREPVNAPSPFTVRVLVDGQPLSALSTEIANHCQQLDLSRSVHHRETTFLLGDGDTVSVRSERFLSLSDTHVGAMRFSVSSSKARHIVIETSIDGQVWDINGPHLTAFASQGDREVDVLAARTHELDVPVCVAALTRSSGLDNAEISFEDNRVIRRLSLEAEAGVEYSIERYVAFFTGRDGAGDPLPAATEAACAASLEGWDALLEDSGREWQNRWASADVTIEGDEEAQLALRYSIYHLLIIAPESDRQSIPARGLSGQVYKGGIFWDTEMFMLPFFDHTLPELARNLIRYRYHTLDGARRKAAEYGFRGAFYAWESQETGDDACSHFNVTDVHTGRPMRTHFRDKQVHISGDVAFAIWRHYRQTGDLSVLVDGGAEVILECARFFVSYAWFKAEKDRYEVLDVVGPDEYHERVDNNAFTSAMVAATLRIALDTVDLLSRERPAVVEELIGRLDFLTDLGRIRDMDAKLHRPEPDPVTGVIEQFTGYHKLEDSTPDELKKRMLHPTEYWGGGHGLATTTKVIKQADVVLMLHLFSGEYSEDIKRANWDYYEPRTEHGSSLSPCVYALLAAELGRTEWAYKYFLRTATIDLTGKSKQYIGPLYIGGTHPAANGGAWMAAVLGFGGLRLLDGRMTLTPHLPEKWTRLAFRFAWSGRWFTASITPDSVKLTADAQNAGSADFTVAGQDVICAPGQTLDIALANTVHA